MDAKAKKIIERLREEKDRGERLQIFNAWRRENRDVPDFSASTWMHLDLSRTSGLAEFDARKLNLRNATFIGCNLTGANFRGKADLTQARFIGCTLKEANFDDAVMDGAVFTVADPTTQDVHGYSNTDASDASFRHVEANGVRFYCTLRGAVLESASLVGAVFDGSDISGTKFTKANLERASLQNVVVNASTSFSETICVADCQFDRYAIACLGLSFGGLTEGNRMDMAIVDDVAMLRSQFGGIWRFLHFLSVGVFLFPYAWFLFSHWMMANFSRRSKNSISLGETFVKFILRGGRGWHDVSTTAPS